MKNIVYILGAGCSAFKDGYPLARDFREALKAYGDTLGQRPNCERLKQCLTNTIGLMEQYQSPTIDRLVGKILEELERPEHQPSSCGRAKREELERSADDQILDAKNVTAALFLEREGNARRTGLHGYRDFFEVIFEGNHNPSALESSNKRVLSFNYDRLFEIAFADFFRLNSGMHFYGKTWLNSGIDFLRKQAEDVALDRFCFLKLHGSAGLLVAEQYGRDQYGWNANQNSTDILVDDSLFRSPNPDPRAHPRENPEPLIVFPVEKHRARSSGTSFLFDKYIRTIWGDRNEPGYAETLVQEAEQIWVIGYSFDPHDRKALIDLLRKSDRQIVVQNKTQQGATDICTELGLRYPDLDPRLKPFGKPF
ncbi:MAG: SIR2 family protein [Verrucomicrobiales bacterium]|nr:SIR2 family protein [Verrucomicrobiales bacterium]